jgi:hypothetical protein
MQELFSTALSSTLENTMSKERVLELLKKEVIASVRVVSKELLTLVFSSEEHDITTNTLRSLLETEELHRENHFFLKGFFSNFPEPGLWVEFYRYVPPEKRN